MGGAMGGEIHVDRGASAGFPRELLGLLKSGGAEFVAQGRVGREAAQAVGNLGDVFGIHGQGRMADHLAEGAAGGRKHGAATRHRFDGRQAEALEEGGVNERAGRGIEVREIVVGDESEGLNIGCARRIADGPMNRVGAMPIAAGQSQLARGTGVLFETREGLDQAKVVFSGVLEARDVKEEGRGQTVAIENAFSGDLETGWRSEPAMVDAIVDDGDSLGGNGEETNDIARGAPANGDDARLASGEVTSEDASVKHALPVVFSPDVKRREIVNGGNPRRGAAKGHAPIRGDVKNVEPKLSGQARQNGLVPEDVLDGVPASLGHWHDRGVVPGEGEKRLVVFENKQDQLDRTIGLD